MEKRVEKVVLITGGARMGQSIAEALSSLDYSVVLTWRESQKAANDLAARLTAAHRKAVALRCDLSDVVSITSLMADIQLRFGRLDAVVNLASVYKKNGLEMNEALASWREHLESNAQGAYALSLAAAPLMKSTGGHMVHITDWTSASGRPRYDEFGAYYISKSAIKATVESLALSLAPHILVNAIAPGPILPPPDLSPEEHQRVVEATPLKRWGGVDEITRTVLFLLQTQFVTGETIRVDGGRHLN